MFGVFELNVEGKKLLQKLHELYIDSVAFPAIPAQLTQFGSPEIYAGFKSGQANVIKFLEFQIKQIKDGN